MNNEKTSWLERPIHPSMPAVTNERLIFAGIILLAIISRFYNLGARVMSHDESLHTYFSWLLYKGQGYQHTPMMHGPWQFHWIALSYFLFGVSDFTARIPAAVFSISTIWLVWYWRHYLGKVGALIAGFLMVISPFLLFYGRYVREDVYTGLSGMLMLYSVLRYLEVGEKKYLFLTTIALIIHFADKETSFIYSAELLIFLGLLFLFQVTRKSWTDFESSYRTFVIALAAGVLLLTIGAVTLELNKQANPTLSMTETAAPANPTGTAPATGNTAASGVSLPNILLALGLVGVVVAAVIYFYLAYIRHDIPKQRSFDLLILNFTFVLPMLSAFVINFLKKVKFSDVTIPTDAASVSTLDSKSMLLMGIVLVVLFAIAITLGLLWNRDWWKYGAVFWGIFTLFYTTFFTNAAGFFTGLVGSLGYWLVQQGVQRGSQPWYYYILVQIPMYEFLPAIGAIVGIILGLKKLLEQRQADSEVEAESEANPEVAEVESVKVSIFPIFFSLLTYWSIMSIVSLSFAGERMPWLTYHMAWPMVLLTGWALGQIIESLAPRLADYKPQQAWLSLIVMAVFLLAVFNAIRAWYGATPPFQGTDLTHLQATSAFLLPAICAVLAGILLAYLSKNDLSSIGLIALIILAFVTFGSAAINGASYLYASSNAGDPSLLSSDRIRFIGALIAFIATIVGIVYLTRTERTSPLTTLFMLTIFGLLTVQTIRTAYRAAYINYDDATEYMVYAHGATGVKEVVAQVSEISKRTSGGLNAVVAYDASAPDTGVSWPMVWYLRDFTALRSFDQPTRSLREAVAVIVDAKNFDKIEGALGDGFYRFDYIRMWWPNQDYFATDPTRFENALANPAIREGIFDIWFNRDYTKYAQATNNNSMTLTTWEPSDRMRLYIRKDVTSQIWNYGVGPSVAPAAQDPYKAGEITVAADQIFGAENFPPNGLNAPRSIAVGVNNDLYVADSRNHRIVHFSQDGTLLNAWGSFADISTGNAPLGTFNEPWGVAVGPDGSVYVTDTWNHRVQKFTADGKPIKSWGQYGQPSPDVPESASSFWGPRGIAVDKTGRVYVADTGNKRIAIFDQEGKYITEFGSGGFDPGQFDEPVGVAVGPSGTVYVTDTWNQRIQTFVPDATHQFYVPTKQWDVNAWFGQSLDNKPFIALDANENVYITDPEGYRIIEFTSDGKFVRTWGEFGSGPEELGLAAGIAIDQEGHAWVTDAGNNRVLRYTLP